MADINLIIKRIPELTELLSLSGSEYFPIYDPSSDTTKKIKASLLQGGTDETLQWNSSTTYNTGDIVEWGLKLWKSLIDNNTNHIPAENSYWTEVSKSESNGFGVYSAGVYTIDPTLVVKDNRIYLLNTDVVTMPFDSTDFDNELSLGYWIDVSGDSRQTSIGEVATIAAMTALIDFNNNDTVFVAENNTYYRFDETDETGKKPDDNRAGSWVVDYELSLPTSRVAGLEETLAQIDLFHTPVASNSEIRAIENWRDGAYVLNYGTMKGNTFDIGSTDADDDDTVLLPDNLTSGDSGRWIKTVEYASNIFTASFSFSGIDNFKQVFGKDVIITSVTTAPDITDLRIGLNGATPTTITTPLSIAATDVVEFEATYNQEADSYFTLIGKEICS